MMILWVRVVEDNCDACFVDARLTALVNKVGLDLGSHLRIPCQFNHFLQVK
jgi:hypothetical protein